MSLVQHIKNWLGFSEMNLAPIVEEVEPIDELLALAIVLTKRENDLWPSKDGEGKRASVYGQLTNTFPNRNKREVSMAIEEALQCSD